MGHTLNHSDFTGIRFSSKSLNKNVKNWIEQTVMLLNVQRHNTACLASFFYSEIMKKQWKKESWTVLLMKG